MKEIILTDQQKSVLAKYFKENKKRFERLYDIYVTKYCDDYMITIYGELYHCVKVFNKEEYENLIREKKQ